MTNPCQDPTPEQEAMHEKDCEIAYLKEQLAEAVRLISISTLIHGIWCEEYWARKAAFLDQNEDLNKPTE